MRARAFQTRNVLDRAPGAGVPNMTPMVDVTLVILVFFMASASIAGPEWFLRAALVQDDPAEPASLSLPSPVVRAGLFVTGQEIRVRGFGDERSLDEAINAVWAMDPSVASGLEVEIEADDRVPYAELVRLHAALVDRGAEVRLHP